MPDRRCSKPHLDYNLTLRIPGELRSELDRLAAQQERTTAWVARRCIELSLPVLGEQIEHMSQGNR